MSRHAFICYSHADIHIKQEIANQLNGSGLTTWDDGEIGPGQHFGEIIQRKIADSACILLLLTQNAASSDFVFAEAKYAKELQIPIVPVLIDVNYRDISILWHALLQQLNFIETSYNEFHIQINKIIQAVSSYSFRITKVFSTFNMKGGVGKTALTAQIGARLGTLRQNRILIIDIDPQQNLTEIFMNHVAIEQMHQKHKTIVGMFEPGRIDQNATVENLFTFNFDGPLNSGVYTDIVSNFYAPVDKINRISIVLSQFEAIKYTRIDANQAVAAKARFTESIQALKRHFDAILIDCNPSASLLTQCALSVADHILVPVQPDNAARRGLIFTSRALSSFYNLLGKRMHIIFNIVKRRNNEQANIIRWIRDRDNNQIPGISVFNGDIFNSEIPESRALHFPYQTLMPNPAEPNFRGFVRPISIGTLPDTRLSELASEIDALLPGGNANAT